MFRKVEGNGRHTIVWKADADLPGLKIPGARAVVTAWAMNDTPDYMVVDISSSDAAEGESRRGLRMQTGMAFFNGTDRSHA